jgi:hypothetical protein
MGNAYSRIKSRSELEFLYLRAQIILSEQLQLDEKSVAKQKNFPNWLQVLKPRVASSQEGEVLDKVMHELRGLRAENKALSARLEALENDLGGHLSAKIKDSKTLLSAIMNDLDVLRGRK